MNDLGSDSLRARSLRAVWHPCTQMQVHEKVPLIELARGVGPWLIETLSLIHI